MNIGRQRVSRTTAWRRDRGTRGYASFGKGTQITGGKFDYCVFVVFDKASEKVREVLVFRRDELKDVGRIRKGLAAHEDTNPCLLICAPTLQAYEDGVKLWGIRPLAIERL